MKFSILFLYYIFTIFTIAEDDPFEKEESEKAVQENNTFKIFPDPSGNEYFPKDKASYYTRYLSAMKEPSVKAKLEKNVDRVIRFTYLRSFHDPLVIRLTTKGDVYTGTATRLEKDEKHDPVKISFSKAWILAEKNTNITKNLFTQKDFWKPLNNVEKTFFSRVKDGSQWIFEIHDKDGYRMIDVWCPDYVNMPDDELKELGVDPTQFRNFLVYFKTGNQMLKLGNIQPKPDENY